MNDNPFRNALFIIAGFVLLWYVGAMLNFFPFYADDLAIRAIGFTGFLLCAVIAFCTCWIVDTIRKK
ncbi:MAG: hypothetical protein SO063_01320 [Eubacteriales bacterium]|nr:hypothetical protein [Eubacteriales bacterium]